MGWTALALVSAFTFASADALLKRYFSHLTPLEMTGVRLVWVAPFALAIFLLMPEVSIRPGFWRVIAVMVPLEVAATLLYMYALRVSPLSLTLPFLSFTPVFLILTGLLILGELPSPAGTAGIFLVFTGGYLIFLSPAASGPLGPIRALAKERGTTAMLGVALIYALTSAMGKKAIWLSNPLAFCSIYFLVLAAVVSIIIAASYGREAGRAFRMPLKGFAVGAVMAVSLVCHVYAITMVKAAYFISVKRLSLMFGILYGWLLFSEENILRKLAGGSLMVAGVAVINLWGR